MQRKRALEDIIVVLVATAVIFWIAITTRSLFSGYHLVDDHMIYYHVNDIEQNGFFTTLIRVILGDFSIRFRPLYQVEQVLGSALFKTNMNTWMFYSALKGVVAVFFIWKFVRSLSVNYLYSALFTGVCILGPQFIIWARSANQENTGMMLTAITLYLVVKEAKARYQGKTSLKLSVLLGILILATSLIKEAFVIMIPAYILLSIAIAFDKDIVGKNSQDISFKSLKGILKNGMPQYVIWLAIMALELIIIVFFVGTNEIGYAGFSKDTELIQYLKGIVNSMLDSCIGLTCLIVSFTIYELYTGKSLKKYVGYLSFGIYIIASQLVLHAKSGMWQRYIIPYVIGVAILTVVVFAKQVEREDEEQEWSRWIFLSVLIVFMIVSFNESIDITRRWARASADDRKGICTELMSLSKENEDILLMSDDVEHVHSIKIWLEVRNRNVRVFSEDMDCSRYRILVIEDDIEDETELLDIIKWDSYDEVYNDDGFVVWTQEIIQ